MFFLYNKSVKIDRKMELKKRKSVYFSFFFFLCICIFYATVSLSYNPEKNGDYIWFFTKYNPVVMTKSLHNLYARGRNIASQLSSPKIQPVHVAFALFENYNSIGCSIILKLGGSIPKLRQALINEMKPFSRLKQEETSETSDDSISNESYVDSQFNQTSFEMLKPNDKTIFSIATKPSVNLVKIHEKMLQAKIERKDIFLSVYHFLLKMDLDQTVRQSLHASLSNVDCVVEFLDIHHYFIDGIERMHEDSPIDIPLEKSSLSENGEDMIKEAEEGKYMPIINREEEIRAVLLALMLKNKANPLLIGEPGIGKSAIINEIARRIVNNEIASFFKKFRIYKINIMKILSNTNYRGDFEKKMKKIVDDALRIKNIILFFDEIHLLMSAGKGDNSIQASEILKPFLARGDIRIIGTTTIKDYKSIIKNGAFERRFQKIFINEVSEEAAISILRVRKNLYEMHHQLEATDGAIISAVRESKRYLPEGCLPDKAFDIFDRACANLRYQLDSQPEEIDELERKISRKKLESIALKADIADRNARERKRIIDQEISLMENNLNRLKKQFTFDKFRNKRISELRLKLQDIYYRKQKAEMDKSYEDLQIIYKKMSDVLSEIKFLERSREVDKENGHLIELNVLQPEHISAVISAETGIAMERIGQSVKSKMRSLRKDIHKLVIGQEDAIRKVCQTIINSRLGFKSPNQPVATFLFIGPTGVGKTELAKALASTLYDSEKFFIRFDMSEFSNYYAVSRFIGSPPGFIGHEEGGELTEKLRENPSSVVLLDEMEKSADKIKTLFLQVFDEGRLTDGMGYTVDCKNSLFIMTSNLGSHLLKYELFDEDKYDLSDPLIYNKWMKKKKEIKDLAIKKARESFSPEFLNRLDGVIVFEPLTKSQLMKILKLQLKNYSDTLIVNKNIAINFDEESQEAILLVSNEPQFGARPINRFINIIIGNEISTCLLNNILKEHSVIRVTKENISELQENQQDEDKSALNENKMQDVCTNYSCSSPTPKNITLLEDYKIKNKPIPFAFLTFNIHEKKRV